MIQRLFATGLSLQGLSRLVDDRTASDRIQQSVNELDDTIRDIRGVIFALQARERGDESLRVAVLAAAQEASATLGFEPRVHFEGAVDSVVVGDQRDQLLTVLREGLTNIAKHADASAVDIYLTAASDIGLRLVDNGKGPGPKREGGQGLENMRQRANALHGRMSLTPGAENGSVLTWTIPRQDG